ncbi:MAG: hypothetical protein AB7R40_24580 [Nitrospiraceae bacterium]
MFSLKFPNPDNFTTWLSFVLLIVSTTYCCHSAHAATSIALDEALIRELLRGKPYKIEGSRATFEQNQHNWTIVGAAQERNRKWHTQGKWQQPEAFKLFAVGVPITNTTILPFAMASPGMSPLDSLRFETTAGEYESLSFVVRTGSESLDKVALRSSTLTCTRGAELPAETIDIRLVIPWFQAGHELNNSRPQRKELVSELLVHDQDIVRVDYEAQVNIVRDYARVRDTNTLQDFRIPPLRNQQLWVTVHVPDGTPAGLCSGRISIDAHTGTRRAVSEEIPFTVKIIEGVLPSPPTSHALYYVGGKENLKYSGTVQDVNAKSLELIRLDLADMKENGNTNVVLMHDYDIDAHGLIVGRPLEPLLKEIRDASFPDNVLLYRDRTNFAIDNPIEYRRKIDRITKIAKRNGFAKIGIFHIDEAKLERLLEKRESFSLTRESGAHNITTIKPEYALELKELLDVGIIHRNRSSGSLREHGLVPWAYNNPQAGKEVPGDIRWLYGFGLWLDGFDGACGFAYQAARHAWDDWATPAFRAHLMTYPSTAGPIPTIQWIAWREGIDDLRYLRMVAEKVHPGIRLLEVKDRPAFLEEIIGTAARSENPTLIRRALVSALEK